MEANGVQKILFRHIKELIPPNLSMVDEVADILSISNDSAYRRIRGDKPIALEEVQKLCIKYKISLDQLLHINTDSFLFTGNLTNNTDFDLEKWLLYVLQVLQTIKMHKPCHMLYLAKEIPFYYYFLLPEIASFKFFFFMKSILFYEDWKHTKFSVKDDYSKYHELSQKISNTYADIPSTEIWNLENITSTIHQIEFYRATGSLKSDEDALCLLTKLVEMIDHIETQAECGCKLHYGQLPLENNTTTYKMYINELILADNMQLLQLGEKQLTYINHTVLNGLVTADPTFNNYVKKTMDVITQKSTLISEVNEKDRLMFFKRLRVQIKTATQNILLTM